MSRILAIGDIHGCNDAFQQMLFAELKINKEDEIYCIGDYIDRGPNSKDVIDTIISLREEGYQINTSRGNHEQMMMDAEMSMENFQRWFANGGNTTLESFDVDRYSAMPGKYKEFFESTEYYFKTNDYIFVHAGLNFEKDDIFEDKDAMLWIRDFSPQQDKLGNKILIHGHTPQSLHYVLSQKGNCINIDAGCVYNNRRNLGNLVTISLPAKEYIVVKNKGNKE